MLQRDRQRQRERGTAGGGGAGAFTAEYLVVAGGGGGGSSVQNSHAGGGAGAGGYRSSVTGESSGGGASAESALSIALGTPYTVTVGSGGSSVTSGNSSTFGGVVSTGGGHGGTLGNQAENGGSGGGAFTNPSTNTVGLGTSGQGFAGGSNTTSAAYRSGGGGGAGAVGTNGADQATAGNGGAGVASLITGASIYRAGGGGGGASNSALAGDGGLGGGGDGAETGAGAGSAGAVNTGGGGGGGGESSSGAGGAGGSGVVIIRVPSTVVAEFSAGVVYNYIPTDDFNVYEITAAGVSDTVTFSQGAVTTVGESLRFNDDDSAYLSRTPASAGDRKTWTWSAWVKRGNLGTAQTILGAGNDSSNEANLSFSVDDTIEYFDRTGGTALDAYRLTTATFRDPSAWYHFVLALNTTSGTASERIKLYVNGKQITDFSSAVDPVLNYESNFSNNVVQYIGKRGFNLQYFDGYLSDVYFIDGEALDPSRFGKQDADGIWQPISYTGSYGTNGFHLDFADNSTAAALGTDTSGNGNDWTPSGITTDDQVTDTPSVNYATLNPLDWNITYLADGNLYTYNTLTAWQLGRGNFGVSSGKWYWETTGATTNVMVGIATSKASLGSYVGGDAHGWGYFSQNGNKYNNATLAPYGATYSGTDVIGVAFDADNGTLEFYKNGTSQGTAFTGLTDGPYFPAVSVYNSAVRHNFGQTPFAHTPPTGFQALNSSNLPAPTITDGKAHFQPALYTGNGTTQAIGGLEFQPDFVWIKNRSGVNNHILSDAVRGAGVGLASDATAAEFSIPTDFQSFDASGFTVGYAGFNFTNGSGINYVAWNWNAGGSTVTNTDGSITSQVRANTDAGFSIVGYTGTGSTATIGHGLTQAPQVIIIKGRDTTFNWIVYTETTGASNGLQLDTTIASTATGAWNNTAPTSSVFTQAGGAATGGSGNTYIAYCFHSVDGFSKFGSYTGNGSTDGPFVYTGFRPAFVMVKKTNATQSWAMMDNKRTANYNDVDGRLFADLADAEATGAACDFLSNGLKLRGTQSSSNGSGDTYIYMAFAENPFKTARAR